MANTDKLKQLLREEAPLPSDLSWEAMQSSIIPGLNESVGTKAPYYKWVSVLVLFVVLGSITAYYFTLDSSPAATQVSENTGIAQSENQQSTKGQDPSPASNQYTAETQSASVALPTTREQVQLSTPVTSLQTEGISSTPQATTADKKVTSGVIRKTSQGTTSTTASRSESTPHVFTERLSQSGIGATTPSSAEVTASTYASAEQEVSSMPTSTTTIDRTTARATREELTIAHLVGRLDLIEIQKAKPSITAPYSPLDIKPAESSLAKNNMTVSLGSNLWARNTDLNDYERSLAGPSVSLQYERHLSRKVSLSTGLRYRSLRSRLDYYDERDTLVRVDQYQVNTLTGQRDTVGISTAAYQYREIRHLNQTTLLSIPLMINYHGSLSRSLTWHAGVGVEYTLLAGQSGRHLEEDLASDGFRSAQPLLDGPYDQLTGRLGLQVSTGLDYALYDNISATLRVGAVQAGNSWSSNAPSHPTIADISLGIRYAW
jgi:opacity protein-like surface antigen